MNDDFTIEYTMNIVRKVKETESDFIFETILPFCENVAQQKHHESRIDTGVVDVLRKNELGFMFG